jgi:tetratricopeptide (TPR) repeat protein
MTNQSGKKSSLELTLARKALAEARTSGDQRKISVAAADVGLALFKVKKFKEGARSFNEVDRIFKELDDFDLQVYCLGIKMMAYQLTEQYPQAFQTAREIEDLAVTKEELGVQSDALATQGQILVESGEEVIALEKLTAALEIAENTGDKRRQMNVMGAFGNYCMTIASAEKAEAYYKKAHNLARELGDRESEIGFHGNLGTLLEWKGELQQARGVFEEVLAYVRETDNQATEIQALRRLTQVNVKLKDDYQIIKWTQQGVNATQAIGNDDLNFFSENLIAALYRLKKFDEAHQATSDAIEVARAAKDRKKEVDLLLSLGESYMLANKPEQALETYQQALVGTQRLQRMVDKGYVLGRMGMLLAELNRADEALSYHKEAIELAQKQDILELEGEQSAMLAMAYREMGEWELAREYAATAVHLYTTINQTDQADKARKLLAEIESATKNQTNNGGCL